MSTVSSCLIVKNEKNSIRACIESLLPFSDEIIIYDTGSDDGTQDICRQYGKVKLIQGEWRNDFAWARNQSFSYAKCDYIFWMDADDIIKKPTLDKILELKACDFMFYDAILIKYDYSKLVKQYFYRERFIRRSLGLKWIGKIHEAIKLNKNMNLYHMDYDYCITHTREEAESGRNIEYFKKMEQLGERFTSRELYLYGKEYLGTKEYALAKEKFNEAIESKGLTINEYVLTYLHLSVICELFNDMTGAIQNALLCVPLTTIPRADICCRLGDLYKKAENYSIALMWYDCALKSSKNFNPIENDFLIKEMCTTYPALNACVCAHQLGNIDAAIAYNNLALKFDPNDKFGISNKEFFDSLKR